MIGAPFDLANSRIPCTELWASSGRMNAASEQKGKASPTSLSAALALAVKTTVDPGGALKKESTAARAVAVSAADSFELQVECVRDGTSAI